MFSNNRLGCKWLTLKNLCKWINYDGKCFTVQVEASLTLTKSCSQIIEKDVSDQLWKIFANELIAIVRSFIVQVETSHSLYKSCSQIID